MKKKSFNDKLGLTQSVLDGSKTMMREIIKCPKNYNDFKACQDVDGEYRFLLCNIFGFPEDEILPKYKVGEVVAVAQSYKELRDILAARGFKRTDDKFDKFYYAHVCDTDAGWNNKMLVKSDLMPHRIKITGIKAERLQDISDEDCLREGISYRDDIATYNLYGAAVYFYRSNGEEKRFSTSKEAFAAFINEILGTNAWERNPYVFCYNFELID